MESESRFMIIIRIESNHCKGRNEKPGTILQIVIKCNKMKAGLTLPFPPSEERETKVSSQASAGPSGARCSVAGLGAGKGESPLASPFRSEVSRPLEASLFSFFQATLHLISLSAQVGTL